MCMEHAYDTSAPKKAANLSINGDLLARCRQLNINLSATLERALAVELATRQREQWLAVHEPAMVAYNAAVDQHGVFSDDLRSF